MRDKLIKKLKELEIVRWQKVKLKNAGASDFYIDIKKAYGNPEAMALMVKIMGGWIKSQVRCVAASGYGGLPLAATIAAKYNLQLTLIREKPKTHGLNVWIDGYVPAMNDKIIIVDDVLSTGESLKQMIKVLSRTKAKILECYVVVKRGSGKLKVPCRHILEVRDLL
jgi:orotate phosphoribosyltransferase